MNNDIFNEDATDFLDLLSSLNLIGVANSRVGDVDERGISGGERKRLSVALQLLGNPRYLIADEPTRYFFLFPFHFLFSVVIMEVVNLHVLCLPFFS